MKALNVGIKVVFLNALAEQPVQSYINKTNRTRFNSKRSDFESTSSPHKNMLHNEQVLMFMRLLSAFSGYGAGYLCAASPMKQQQDACYQSDRELDLHTLIPAPFPVQQLQRQIALRSGL